MTLLLVVDLIPATLWAQIKALLGQAGESLHLPGDAFWQPRAALGQLIDLARDPLAGQRQGSGTVWKYLIVWRQLSSWPELVRLLTQHFPDVPGLQQRLMD